MKKFDLDYFIVESCKKNLYSKGIDLSSQEILDKIKNISKLAMNDCSDQNFAYLWTMYNKEPPPPPYSYTFETEDEAINFANRAMKKYNIICDIVSHDSGHWKLKSKNEIYRHN